MKYYETLVERMTSYYCGQAHCTPDQASDVMIRIRVLAAQLDACCQEAEEAAKQAFAGTAQGEALERHAALRGLVRKEGTKATGVVAFRRSTPAGYNILIPAGTVVQSGGPEALRFATSYDITMGGGATSVLVAVEALEPGSQYNLKVGEITVMVAPPPGITQVDQIAVCAGGTDQESDEALRARLLDSCRNPAVGGSPGFYRGLMLAQSGVGRVKVLPAHRGGGTLDLAVYGENGPLNESTLAALRELFAGERDLGIDVAVRGAQSTPVNLELELAVGAGWDFAAVSAGCKEALTAAMARLDIGEPWLLARMNQAVMAQAGVRNCRILLPAADAFPLEDRVLVPGGITITPMEVAV